MTHSKSAPANTNLAGAPNPKENTMTERPYTDAELRTLAVRVHESAARDSDSLVNGAVKRKWGAQLDVDQLDEAGDELIGVLDKAANTSRWAVDLGADGLVPDGHSITIGGTETAARIHFAFAPGLDDGQRAAIVHAIAHHVGDCDIHPT